MLKELLNRNSTCEELKKRNEELEKQIEGATQLIKNIHQEDFLDLLRKNRFLNDSRLGQALLSMKKELQKIEEQKAQRNWITEGIAHFSDLLRTEYSTVEEFGFVAVQALVKYLKANQACLWVRSEREQETLLRMVACYAYSRKKHHTKTILPGEGMTGQVYLEGLTTYLTEIPKDYIKITSGLGQAPPNALLLVPLKINEEVLGVLEIASFSYFPLYQIEFLEKACEIIAGTLKAVDNRRKTDELLQESRAQTLRLQEQEEELRQNSEEMQATQEEMKRKQLELIKFKEELEGQLEEMSANEQEMQAIEEELRQNMEEMMVTQDALALKEKEMRKILEALNASNLVAEFDRHGDILHLNDKFCELFGVKEEEVIGLNHRHFDSRAKENPEAYRQIWDKLKAGESVQAETHILLEGRNIWLKETYTPLMDKEGSLFKVMIIASDISDNQAELISRQTVISELMILSESDLYGNITFVNDKLCQVSMYSREELLGQPHKIFRHPDMPKEIFKEMWETIKRGKTFRGIIKNRRKDGGVYWVDAVIAPVLDSRSKPVKYIGARYVIEDHDWAERSFNKMLEKKGLKAAHST
jgi:PAS domain S-box-containing protein